MKAYYVAVDHPERRAAGITTVFIDRAIGLLDLVILAGAAILINWSQIAGNPWLRGLAVLIGVILAGALLGGGLFFSERVRSSPLVRALFNRLPFRGLIGKIQAAVYIYKFHPWLVLEALAISLLVQLSVIGMAFSYASALDLRARMLNFFFIVPIATLATAIPTGSPGGLGQLEGAYMGLFGCFGYADENGLFLALVQRLNAYFWSLFGGVLYFRRHGQVKEARRLAREDEGLPESEVSAVSGPGGGGGWSRPVGGRS